jgi:C4-dicarboxylate-specific signal transduction histidine kinase
MLMTSMCQAARSKIEIRGYPAEADGMIQWVFRHDGPPANADQLSWLQAPFSTTRQARFGLGLAFARRVIELHGGRITASEGPQGGSQFVLLLPPGPTEP